MPKEYGDIRRSALKNIAAYMCVSARTAPKARGRDNLSIVILSEKEKQEIIAHMKKQGKKEGRPGFLRDAENIKSSGPVVIIGTRNSPLGLDCGFCGYPDCKSLSRTKGLCSYNSLDLGIALGSAASLASDLHADNRLMYSAGKAAIELGFLNGCSMAIGIPLSATGKNIFFDRA